MTCREDRFISDVMLYPLAEVTTCGLFSVLQSDIRSGTIFRPSRDNAVQL